MSECSARGRRGEFKSDNIRSRNQLTSLPREICRLPLQTLLVAHNRLASLPDELGRMTALAELDAGCNEITNLPPRMGDLAQLRSLDLRSNLLVHLPIGRPAFLTRSRHVDRYHHDRAVSFSLPRAPRVGPRLKSNRD